MDKVSAQKTLKRLPDSPGVYLFWFKKTPIYIGKAKSLKNRVNSYFLTNLAPKTSAMVKEAQKLTYIKVNSELEALLLEATLIRKNQPRYNSASKDDKHPLYIRITSDTYPRVVTARKKDLGEVSRAFFGPFPNSGNVHSVLKMLRRIFPFADHLPGSRACFNSQLGFCDPCPSEIENLPAGRQRLKRKIRKLYLGNIRMLKKILSGNIGKVFNDLRRDMEKFSKEEKFEEAARIREQIQKLEYVTQPIISAEHFLENPNLSEDLRRNELADLKSVLMINSKWKMLNLHRIEAYDVAHLRGASPTASMVTFINGEPDKTFYRHFRIRQKDSQNDLASLTEVGERRTGHFEEWGKPDLIMVDGGTTQLNVFIKIFSKYDIPIVGIAKRYETLVFPEGREVRLKRGPALNLVQRLRDEAHRFARRYHQKLLARSLMIKKQP